CGAFHSEGASWKVDSRNNLLCRNGGSPRDSFCTDGFTKVAPISHIDQQGLRTFPNERSYQFVTIGATSESGTTQLRIFKNAVVDNDREAIFHAEIEGDLVGGSNQSASVQDPSALPVSGNFVCIHYKTN
ncbi:MAG: hypothetical protein WCO71_01405, partial [Pseudomonadota bacterium]